MERSEKEWVGGGAEIKEQELPMPRFRREMEEVSLETKAEKKHRKKLRHGPIQLSRLTQRRGGGEGGGESGRVGRSLDTLLLSHFAPAFVCLETVSLFIFLALSHLLSLSLFLFLSLSFHISLVSLAF